MTDRATDVDSIEAARAVLYGQPLDSFVAERNELVKAVRGAGDRELANEIKTLRKPSALAALVNHVVRGDPAGVELILQAAELLRAAQAGALDGAEISAAALQDQYRAAIQALARSAPSRQAEVRAALEAATVDEASNEDLRIGCLVAIPTPPSIFGSASPASTPAPGVDELAERRAAKKAKTGTADKPGAEKELPPDRSRAAERRAAAEAARLRKEAVKEHRKRVKAAEKQLQAAVQVHRDADLEHQRTTEASRNAELELAEIDREITSLEATLDDLRDRQVETVRVVDRHQAEALRAQELLDTARAAVEAHQIELARIEGDAPA